MQESEDNNRKHHKYVTVNKYQRKKQRKFFDIIKLRRLSLKWLYESIKEIITSGRYSYDSGSVLSCLPTGCNVIFDDCNHTKGRIVKKKKNSKTIQYFRKTKEGYQIISHYDYRNSIKSRTRSFCY